MTFALSLMNTLPTKCMVKKGDPKCQLAVSWHAIVWSEGYLIFRRHTFLQFFTIQASLEATRDRPPDFVKHCLGPVAAHNARPSRIK